MLRADRIPGSFSIKREARAIPACRPAGQDADFLPETIPAPVWTAKKSVQALFLRTNLVNSIMSRNKRHSCVYSHRRGLLLILTCRLYQSLFANKPTVPRFSFFYPIPIETKTTSYRHRLWDNALCCLSGPSIFRMQIFKT